jgi:teichuronic acid biosynthesis glycosyltransferase TuaG
VIIIEDSSTDETHKIIAEFIAGKDNWRLYSNDKNKGVVYSRNKAFDLVQGKYIAILDGDDIWEKEKLEKQYQLIKNNDIELCYTSYSFINEKSQPFNYIYKTKENTSYSSLLRENYIGCSTVVFKTYIKDKIKMSHKVKHEDYYYWLTMLKSGVKAKGIVEPLVKYRVHQNGRSYNKLNAARNRFDIYYRLEQLGLVKSIYYFLFYGLKAAGKYLCLIREKAR